MKKRLLGVFFAALMVVCAAGCGSKEPQKQAASTPAAEAAEATEAAEDDKLTVGFSVANGEVLFCTDLNLGALKACEELGVEAILLDANIDVQKQLNGIDDLVDTKSVDVMICEPADSTAISAAVQACNNAGIPFMTADTPITDPTGILCHVGSDNVDIGRAAGEYAVKLLTERNGSPSGDVLVIGYQVIETLVLRTQGFMEVMEQYPDINIVQKDVVQLNISDAQNLMDDLLQAYPEGSLDLVYAPNATNCVGALAACEAANRTDFDMVGVDDDPAQLEALQKGGILKGTVVQFPTEIGYKSVKIAVDYLRGIEPESTNVKVDVETVTQETINDFIGRYNATQESLAKYKDML